MLYIGSVSLYTCLIAILAYGGRSTKEQEDHTFVHAAVCAIAGTMYFAMASGVADVTLDSGRNYDFGRYLDWSFTTPLLLVGLGMTALHGEPAFEKRAA
jgi:bacteriorhodopsin